MTRLIDANALIHKLKTAIELGQKVDESVSELEAVLDDVESMPTIEIEPQWIPCGERLPAENGTYLVYAPDYRGGSSRGKEWHGGIMFAKFKGGKWSIEHGYYSRPNCVKAWMPLPEPYEAEDDETN